MLRAATLTALLVFLVTGEAHAFCRTTTCNPKKEGNTCVIDPESGCETTGRPLFWASNCVRINIQRNLSNNLVKEEAKGAILRSFAHWQGVRCPGGGTASISFTVGSDAYMDEVQHNKSGPNINVIFFRDNGWSYNGIEGTIATTSLGFDTDTGEIWDADIAINSANNALTIRNDKVRTDLESVLVHEVGHFIGLAHSKVGDSVGNAVMYESYSPGIIRRDLQPDDIEGLCTIYPPNRAATCQDEPKGGFEDPLDPTTPHGPCAASVPAAPPSGATLLGLLGLWRLSQRRKKRAAFTGR